MTPHTAICALQNALGTGGGVYIADDFTLAGPDPTWAAHSGGLPAGDDIQLMRVDPFGPLRRQFVQVQNAGQEIYYRDTAIDDNWHKVLDLAAAIALPGTQHWSGGFASFTNLNWIAPDRALAGRWYSLLSNFYFGPNYPSYLLRTDDYGATWVVAGQILAGRGVGCVEASGATIVVGVNQNIGPFDHTVQVSMDGGATWTVSATNMGYSSGYACVILDPLDLSRCFAYGFNDAGAQELYRVDRATAAGAALQTGLHLASSEQNKQPATPPDLMNPDNLWIDPADGTHQRMQAGGKIYVTHDSWTTVNSPTTVSQSNPQNIATLTSLSDDATAIIYGRSDGSGHVFVLDDESDITPTSRDGALPAAGPVAIYGLHVEAVLPAHGAYLYAVELENAAGDVADERGVPEQGDRAAWRVDDYPTEHAQDLYHRTPHYHSPFPGADGQVQTAQGGQWVSQDLPPNPAEAATQVGQVLISLDGTTFTAKMPVTDPGIGWLVDGATGYLLVS